MRWIAVGTSPTGIVAIGANATGIVAIGPLATGVFAFGQLARGVFSLGQVSVGVVSFGQVAIGLLWSGGMLSIGGTSGPKMIGIGLWGRLRYRWLIRGRLDKIEVKRNRSNAAITASLILSVLVVILVWVAVLDPLWHELTRIDGILREPPRQLR